ncbi:ScyD/ScyE family protein [Nocardioides sp. T2.26MG-1]|uniref:ScyD/ScyE family protein n=1 Tax=Nocardioides sp. T2.26MG-1 TaxID=3041166 RepID=UPI00247750BD|nr:ScyD/ScyE family protein [Nocardioides sp. T2.26MG-1]CAI9414312.1 hypothetical protein HIDPHFAB_02238 [Nocardioides sp. T2.26MG-1]
MRSIPLLAAATMSALAVATLNPLAQTAHSTTPEGRTVLTSGLVGPLSLDVHAGRVYVTQNFAGELDRVRGDGSLQRLYRGGHDEIGGVSARHGRVVFTQTASSGAESPTNSWVKVLRRPGKAHTLTRLWAYEKAHNPDGSTTYGARGISDDCAAQWPTELLGPPVYRGVVDSHPYATFQRKHRVYVADAAMNAVVSVSFSGRVRTVAVLRPVPVPITAGLASTMGVPDCAVGLTYYGEPVPTDVEMGPNGRLLVTTLGGGLGEQLPLGAMHRIDPATGHQRVLARGLSAPTDLAVTHSGRLFVAELFANRIVTMAPGSDTVRTFAKAHLPAAVEVWHGRVYATTDALPPEDGAPNGKVVRLRRY